MEIEQDFEVLDDDIGSQMNVFWCEGHGHDPDVFFRSVIEFCWDNYGTVPRIDTDDSPVEVWQETVNVDGDIGTVMKYRRYPEQGPQRAKRKPITLLDLEHRSSGAPKCAFRDCGKAWYQSTPIRVVLEAGNEQPYMSVYVTVCREHSELMPDPYYRAVIVPVGATIMLPCGSSDEAS